MKTRESLLENKSIKDTTSHINHLERQQSYLMSLNDQLNSYHCVPKTRKLYEQMEVLKKRLQELGEENKKFIYTDAPAGSTNPENSKLSKMQFQKTLALEQAILEYIGKAKIHG